MKFDRCKFAWCAGFFDGEGCTTVQFLGSGGTHTYLRVGQKDPLLLVRMQTIFNEVGIIHYDRHYDNRNGRRADIYRYVISNFEHIQFAMCLMWNWLGPIKKEQYKNVITTHYKNLRVPSMTKGAKRHRRNKVIEENARIEALRIKTLKEQGVEGYNGPSSINPFTKRSYVKN